jgi:hypothetical protein
MTRRAQAWQAELVASRRLMRITHQIAGNTQPVENLRPIAFFNASSRLTGMSLNAAFTLLTACGVQVSGIPVVYFACEAGMSRCVLGTNRDDPNQKPPCQGCITQSKKLFAHAPIIWFEYSEDGDLTRTLDGLSVQQLEAFEYSLSTELTDHKEITIPLGKLTLPSLRWSLRRHNLMDDEKTRFLFREYILSARSLVEKFLDFLDRVDPMVMVIFNGIMFPEAIARWIARKLDIRVVTHEVGFQPFSAFFSDEQATAYPIRIPDQFDLSDQKNANLNEYLEKRFHGEFTMAGIRFWPEMNGLDDRWLKRIKQFNQIVLVFTNVVYDTSQVHANVIFPNMFAWLDLILEIIQLHPETLFIIRAHPDEMRPGTKKQSRESVQAWVVANGVRKLPNVVFIDSQEYISSYELIQRSKFVMVYNSSIGLEATLMGKLVLCGGKARYTQYPMVIFPDSPQSFREKTEQFLNTQDRLDASKEYIANARRFLYYQLFKASLPFDDYLENLPKPGFVRLRSFSWQQLSPEYSNSIRILLDGFLHDKPFINEEA